MKSVVFKSIVFLLLTSFGVVACFKDQPLDDDILRYSSFDEILYPPDTFQVVYVLSTNNNYNAVIEFESNAVWEVVRLTAPGYNRLQVERSDGSTAEPLLIIDRTIDTNYFGLEGNTQYDFVANRSSIDVNYKTFLLQFTKQDIDYDSFSPKI